MEPQKKSLQESLRISRKFPTPFFCCKAVKLRLSHALKTMSLEIFLSRFFSLHVVWTQQLLHQIKLNSLESLQNYAHKNSWANPVCMKTFPTTFARLTVHHFTPNGHFVNWTSLAFIFLYRNSFAYHRILWQIWNSRTTQQIFIKTYEFLIKKKFFSYLQSPRFLMS